MALQPSSPHRTYPLCGLRCRSLGARGQGPKTKPTLCGEPAAGVECARRRAPPPCAPPAASLGSGNCRVASEKSPPSVALLLRGPESELTRPGVAAVPPPAEARAGVGVPGFRRGICSLQNCDPGRPVGVSTRALALAERDRRSGLSFPPTFLPAILLPPVIVLAAKWGCFVKAAKLGCVLFIPFSKQK